ncbi:MAG: hypothetical protein A3F90_02490 [Deltaproteobacteria bacterium RIFCSPLOWO2_12_FULL_60_19]|nr:MAG: hypothetical protein A3F90_02490 [Deltaproteobacteria bacterium RIFCSPLOWO2_12_FULL_60_19]
MEPLRITIACGDYDRTLPLRDGRVKPQRIDLNYIVMEPSRLFPEMLRFKSFEASELSLSAYLATLCRPAPPFIAMPIFPLRSFRHSNLYVRDDSGIERAGDLKGKRVGIHDYFSTAAIWIRGFLEHDYGVAPKEVRWHTGALESGKHGSYRSFSCPDGVCVEEIPPEKNLNDMLLRGELDALVSLPIPSSFAAGAPNVKRLFPNYKETEKEYYLKTKVIPIMHILVLRRDIYERHPWVASCLTEAFEEAERLCFRSLRQSSAPRYPLHWFLAEVEEEQRIFGEGLWPQGIEANRLTLETLIRYAFEQGAIDRLLSLHELFAPNTLERAA